MKILFITTKITDSGGVSAILIKKINALLAFKNIEIAIASTNDDVTNLFFKLDQRVQVFYMKTKMRSILDLNRFKNEFREVVATFQPDLISVTDNGLKSFFIKRFLIDNIPTIYEVHANEQSFFYGESKGIKAKLHHFILQRLLKTFDCVVYQKHQFKLPKNVAKKIFIPNFIKLTPQNQSVNINKFIAVGRIVSTKNYVGLLRIWKKIQTNFPDKELHVYGSWDESDLVNSLKNIPGIYLHKPTTNLNEIFSEAYALLHSSMFESFPMVFLEAMSYGVPVVCYNINQPDLVVNQSTGFVITSNDEAMFIEKTEALILDVKLRKKFSEQGLLHVENFSQDKIIQQWFDLFNSYKLLK